MSLGLSAVPKGSCVGWSQSGLGVSEKLGATQASEDPAGGALLVVLSGAVTLSSSGGVWWPWQGVQRRAVRLSVLLPQGCWDITGFCRAQTTHV